MSESKDTVVFIDDEEVYSMRYVRELMGRFDTHYFDTAVDGLSYCIGHPKLKVVLIDVMMPPPSEADLEDVKDGLETGIWLLTQLRSYLIEQSVGVIVLSNRNITTVREAVAKLGFPQSSIEVLAKIDTPSWNLPIRVQRMIDRLSG